MKTLKDIGEKKLIASIVLPIFRDQHLEVGPGDDAAVIPFAGELSLVLTTDRIPAPLLGQSLGVMDYKDVGRYLVATSLSDLAAMGAKPLTLLLSLTLPGHFLISDFRKLLAGIRESARTAGCSVAGGDTKEGPTTNLVAVAVGTVEKGRALCRVGAEPGDAIFCTGSPGGFGTALAYLLVRDSRATDIPAATKRTLLRKLTHSQPRIAQGRLLSDLGFITACQDISDGLGQTLIELADTNGVGVNLSLPALKHAAPLAAVEVAAFCGCSLETLLLGPGADLELVFTTRAENADAIKTAFLERRWPLYEIGTITKSNYTVTDSDGTVRAIPRVGWSHFRGTSDLNTVREIYLGSASR